MDDKIKILIIDALDKDRKMLVSIFDVEEYHILEAVDGQQALDIVYSGIEIDIIIMNLELPKINGLEVLRRIKEKEPYCRIPVLISAGEADTEKKYKALELGVDNFITKPYHKELLQKWVLQLVERYIKQNRYMRRQVQEINDQLQALNDMIPGGILIMKVKDIIYPCYFNDRFCQVLGYSREEMEAKSRINILDYIYEPDRSTFEEMFKTEKEDKVLQNNIRFKNKEDEIKWIAVSVKRLASQKREQIYQVVLLDISERQEAETQLQDSMMELQFRAERDSLTGIYNRDKFYIETRKMLQEHPEEKYLLAQWNIDRFHIINELFGSSVGDRVLFDMAKNLSERIKGHGTFARLEADHFVSCTKAKFILDNMEAVEKLLVGEGILTHMDYPILLHAGFYKIEDNNMPVDLMCDRAAMAVKNIKNNYIKRWCVYNSKLNEKLLDEQELVNDMEKALKEHQFFVLYQPIIDAKTQKTISAEALVRWQHPTKGMISPGVFIPLFEKNGFVTKLDRYVCEEVCRYIAERLKEGKEIVPISVNLSRINFYNPNLCADIVYLIQKYQIDTSYLKLEVTESAYNDNPTELINTINMFQRSGFKVLMDDFGSGYSSLNMLKDVSVDILKIDMKFMEELEVSVRANNILFSIIQMAKTLEMSTVVEGVETKSQYELLTDMGCDSIQGYYFSKPVSAKELSKRLESNG